MSPRRIRWTVRAVLYGTLALLALAVWWAQPGEKVVAAGKTSQGEHFDLQARDDGEVDGFQTHFVAECDNGEELDLTWTPGDEAPVPFERDGERIQVREEWSRQHRDGIREDGWMTLDGRVADDGRSAAGVMDAEATFSRAGDTSTVCRAQDVRFDAKAPAGA